MMGVCASCGILQELVVILFPACLFIPPDASNTYATKQMAKTYRKEVTRAKYQVSCLFKYVSDIYLSRARNAAGSTSGSSISVDVVAIPPLNMASKTALPTANTNL